MKSSGIENWYLILVLCLSVITTGCDGIDGTGVDDKASSTGSGGGGGSPNNPPGKPPGGSYPLNNFITGFINDGQILTNAPVTVKGRRGKKAFTISNSYGYYIVDIRELYSPYIIKVERDNNKPLYSYARTAKRTNIHPFTDVIVRNWYRERGFLLEPLFNASEFLPSLPYEYQITLLQDALKVVLKYALSEFKLTQEYDIFHEPSIEFQLLFTQLLGDVKVNIEYDIINLTVIDPSTQLKAELITDLRIDSNLLLFISMQDSPDPNRIKNIKIQASSETAITLAWQSAGDDFAVVAYNIYRDKSFLATTVYPIYRDSDLSTDQTYCYRIEAIDNAGNKSKQSADSCATPMNIAMDSTPNAVNNFTATILGSHAISFNWQDITTSNILYYQISSSVAGVEIDNLVSVVSPATQLYTPPGQMNNNCYSIKAVTATANKSANRELCVTAVDDTKAPTTTATPSGGSFNRKQFITLRCDDGVFDSGCKTIYYTTDNSLPDSNTAKVYSKPIIINNTSTIRYMSIDNAGMLESNTKNVQEYTINLDNTGN